jgi:hypothetical protein
MRIVTVPIRGRHLNGVRQKKKYTNGSKILPSEQPVHYVSGGGGGEPYDAFFCT